MRLGPATGLRGFVRNGPNRAHHQTACRLCTEQRRKRRDKGTKGCPKSINATDAGIQGGEWRRRHRNGRVGSREGWEEVAGSRKVQRATLVTAGARANREGRVLRAGAGRRSTVVRTMGGRKRKEGRTDDARLDESARVADRVEERRFLHAVMRRREGVSVCGADGGIDEVARPSPMPVGPPSSEEARGRPRNARGRRGGGANTAACWKEKGKRRVTVVVFKPLYPASATTASAWDRFPSKPAPR
ncbi:hypothetical protein FB451DRAFT_1372410 [Mycena latifolia]|nr:hypothetical protein FB451DRAFT_1372410 [Mycena latifolia]